MNKKIKYALQVLAILAIGFVGGLLGTGASELLKNNTGTNETTINQTDYNNVTSTTKAVEKVQEAVVSVINYQKGSSSDYQNYYSIFEEEIEETEDGLVIASEGSGVIYKKDGNTAYLVTNTHVVSGAEKLDINLSDGSTIEGELVGSDTYSDIAVVKINSDKITAVAEFGDSKNVNVGEVAIAIGSPLGTDYANSVTQGIISSLSRTITSQSEDGQTISTNAIQTDAAINPGNSGGPLINIQGQVVGITSSKIASSSSSSYGISIEGMGFAIPSNDTVAIINNLEKDGKITRPALGIQMSSLSSLSSSELAKINVPSDLSSGVVVVSVQSDLSADGILEKYDIITKIGDAVIESSSDLQSALYTHNVGDTITVTFYRDGKEQSKQIKLTSSTEDLEN